MATAGLSTGSYRNLPFSIYPNPTLEEVNIDFSDLFTGFIILLDGFGKEINRQQLGNVSSLKLSLLEYKQGVYYISAKSEAGVFHTKLVKN